MTVPQKIFQPSLIKILPEKSGEMIAIYRGPGPKLFSGQTKTFEAIAKPDFTVILNEVKDLKSPKNEILRFAQNDKFSIMGVFQQSAKAARLPIPLTPRLV
jgi:hypothetical protein